MTLKKIIIYIFVLSTVALSSAPVFAQAKLGDMMVLTVMNTLSIADLIAFFCFLAGVVFAAVGIHKLRQHVEFGPQKIDMIEPIKFLFTGGLLMSLATISVFARFTFGGIGSAQDVRGSTGNARTIGGAPGTGLDGMLLGFVQNIYNPTLVLLEFFCYVAGILLVALALHRFTKTAEQGPRGPTGLGTIATFVLAGVLFSIGPSVGTIAETLFGARKSFLNANFMALNNTMGVAGSEHAETVATSILAFLVLVGSISIIKGFFVLRGVAEGDQQATMLSGLSHVIAGAILVNFGQFANIIQNTLGITGFGVQFN